MFGESFAVFSIGLGLTNLQCVSPGASIPFGMVRTRPGTEMVTVAH